MITNELQFHSAPYNSQFHKHTPRVAWFRPEQDHPIYIDWLNDMTFFNTHETPTSDEMSLFEQNVRRYKDYTRIRLVTYRFAVRMLIRVGGAGRWEIAPQCRHYTLGALSFMRERRDLAKTCDAENVVDTSHFQACVEAVRVDAKRMHKRGYNTLVWHKPIHV